MNNIKRKRKKFVTSFGQGTSYEAVVGLSRTITGRSIYSGEMASCTTQEWGRPTKKCCFHQFIPLPLTFFFPRHPTFFLSIAPSPSSVFSSSFFLFSSLFSLFCFLVFFYFLLLRLLVSLSVVRVLFFTSTWRIFLHHLFYFFSSHSFSIFFLFYLFFISIFFFNIAVSTIVGSGPIGCRECGRIILISVVGNGFWACKLHLKASGLF
jgi:hypothetical protein